MKASIYDFVDWGLIDYQKALSQQIALAEKTAEESLPGTIVFCSHPEIVTLGSKTRSDDVISWDGPQIQISRGGRATYHGPSQLVIYPIINLNLPSPTRPAKDIHIFLRQFESAIIETLKDYDIKALGKSLQKKNSEAEGQDETGVWFQDQKLASLGIQVKRWVSLHGAAINLEHDSQAFRGIKPCGFEPERMISVEKILNKKLNRNEFKAQLLQRLQAFL